ncbi:hypothetical protein [Mucilaginibacter polytrichastri]|uniref:Nucleotide-diphospho-sugar transferase domain-containing protein n=1 Tax=Mucilaginibacter polytrichastri TaxID=1302689 RepID=A0A1Q6A5S2_9SPHI|nr:hypothetical protein [Mucilaginibacter polytrichastri]OKS89332.1 hypothetical protein RG47T_4816 [Mucilaginibacter polytrichastri]SFS74398.1 hypothetical protein SAMN04487890_103274 [Mucilaginibacter polytrichastri]
MTTKNQPNFALLVHTCDRYQFLYPGFSAFFNKYWDFSIPCTYYFATENLEVNINGFRNIRSGSGQWSDRLAHLLRNEVKEKYVIYFQEDMWLDKPVDATFFKELFKLIESNNWKQVKLTSSDVYQTNPTGYQVEGFTVAQLDNEKSGYLMSHQVTIWDKEYLLNQLPKDEHPWRNERKGTKRLKKLNPEIFQVDYFAENGYQEINLNYNPALRSGYQTISQNSALNDRVLPYINELKQYPLHAAYASELQLHYDDQLTHDGKPKPRKDDIFKRIKNWLKGK